MPIVEIVISDNCSTDQTASLAKQYCAACPNINYYKNEKNYQYDGNIDLVVQRAQGKYVWLLGCGEIVKPGALALIVSRLTGQDFDNILLNFDIYSESTGKISSESEFDQQQDAVFYKQMFLQSFTLTHLTAVSINIVARLAWLNVASTPLQQTGWCHVERILSILTAPNYQATLIIHDLCFTLYREVDGWWTNNNLFTLNLLKLIAIMQAARPVLRETAYKKSISSIYPRSLIKILITIKKANERISWPTFKMVIKTLGRRPSFWIMILPLLLLPNWVYRNSLFISCSRLLIKAIKKTPLAHIM